MMNKQQKLMRPVKNQTSTGGTKTKRRRSKLKSGAPSQKISALPSVFRARGDTVGFRLKGSVNIVNTANGFASWIFALTPASIPSTGYFGLGDLFPLLLGVGAQYSHFMVTRTVAQLIPTTALTGGGYVALGYEPDDSNTSSPPSSLLDVTSSTHSDIAQVSEIAAIEFQASDYYNDWKSCTTTSGLITQLSQAGVVQVWGSNSVSNTTSTGVAIFQLEIDIHFSGFRKTG